jgi:hypothetical protein
MDGAKPFPPANCSESIMETARKSTTRKAAPSARKKIVRAYRDVMLKTGKPPASVYSFCLELGIGEEDFYREFGSFAGVEREIWKDIMNSTIRRLTSDKSFQGFSAREKMLALCYTLLEELTRERSFILVQLERGGKLELAPPFLRDFREAYLNFADSILREGQETGEIARRPYLERGYSRLLWLHLVSLLMFWKADDSPAFTRTDAYVEKSVQLAFDLMRKGAVDSAVDLARFMFQFRRHA